MTLTHCRADPDEEKTFHFEGSKTDTLQDNCEKPMGRQDKPTGRWEQVTKSLCTHSLTAQHNLFALFLSLRKPAGGFLHRRSFLIPSGSLFTVTHF